MRAVAIYFLIQRQRSPSVHLVHRRGGTPCWILFSLAVPGFALPNRFRVVDALCFSSGGGSIERAVAQYFLIQRQRSPDGALCATYGATPCCAFCV